MKKILVTGIAGFVGYFTAKRLINDGYEIVGIDNLNEYYDVNLKYARLQELGISQTDAEDFGEICSSSNHQNLRFIRMNIEDRESMSELFDSERFDGVIHLAAQAGVRYSIENPNIYVDSNIVGFLTILEGCRNAKVKHLVFASSSSVYGESDKAPFEESDRVDHPVSLYAATKKSNELMAYTYSHLYNIPTTGLRFFTVYGPWGRPDMAPMLFADAIIKNKPIKVFNHGEMYRDFTYVEDIVDGIILTLTQPPKIKTEENTPYQLFNIGNGSPIHLLRFIEVMEENMGKSAQKNMMEMQAGDVSRTWADTSQLQKLGYKSSTDIDEGVKKFVEWFLSYYTDYNLIIP